MCIATELSDAEFTELESFLNRIEGGKVPNPEALDGFFAALAVCPDLVLPSEYLPIIQDGETKDGDLEFETMDEAQQFMNLINKHWNHVVHQLNEGEVFLPLLLEDEDGNYQANDWAIGFLHGTHMRREIWMDFFDDEEHAGPMVPIWALAYEHHSDPEYRPFDKPIDKEKREDLIVSAAAGVIQMNRYFLKHRKLYEPPTETFVREGPKVGRNDPCPCGSGRKYKKCCGNGPTLH